MCATDVQRSGCNKEIGTIDRVQSEHGLVKIVCEADTVETVVLDVSYHAIGGYCVETGW